MRIFGLLYAAVRHGNTNDLTALEAEKLLTLKPRVEPANRGGYQDDALDLLPFVEMIVVVFYIF